MTNVEVKQTELENKFKQHVKEFNGNSEKNTERLAQMTKVLDSETEFLLEDMEKMNDTNLVTNAIKAINYLKRVKNAKIIEDKVTRHNELDTVKPIHEYTSIVAFFAYIYFQEISYKRRVEKQMEQFNSVDSYRKYMESRNAQPKITAYTDAKMDFNKYDTMILDNLLANMYGFIAEIEGLGGEILDTKYLVVNEKGNLDGYVECKNNNIAINTFGAGGYNIQRFHYRTNIRVKSK